MPISTASPIQHQIIYEICNQLGKAPQEVCQSLMEIIIHEAEMQADLIQARADGSNAEAESSNEPPEMSIVEVNGMANDDDWEDEDCRDRKGHIPRLYPQPPAMDGYGNKFITVVHSNGFHSLPVIWCNCAGHESDRDLELLDIHLYPATFTDVNTVFTFSCLDDLRYESLECKSSHFQYHSKLRRMTCPEFPDASPNRYAELCRVARQWRNLKYRKWFFVLNDESVERGQMTLFCPACPQDGVNLPPDWKTDQEQNPCVQFMLFIHSDLKLS